MINKRWTVKEYVFRNSTDAIACAREVNGTVGHNSDYTEWYVHVVM